MEVKPFEYDDKALSHWEAGKIIAEAQNFARRFLLALMHLPNSVAYLISDSFALSFMQACRNACQSNDPNHIRPNGSRKIQAGGPH